MTVDRIMNEQQVGLPAAKKILEEIAYSDIQSFLACYLCDMAENADVYRDIVRGALGNIEWDDPEDLYPLFIRIRAVKKRLEAELGGLEAESSIRLRINALKTRLIKYIDNKVCCIKFYVM